MSPRRGSGSSTRSISRSPDSQCLPATAYGAGRRLVGAVREQRRVAGAVERGARVVGDAAVDRDVGRRRGRALDRADRVERDAGARDQRAARLEDHAAAAPGRAARRRARARRAARARTRRSRLRLVGRGRDAEPAAEVDRARLPAESRRARGRRRSRASRPPSAPRRVHQLRADVAWMPSVSGARRSASSASSGGSPNFEPWWPVRMCSCVSASTPGVTRISVRVAPAPARALDLLERVDHDERAGRGGGAQLLVRLVVAVHDEPVARDAGAPARTAARRASRRRRRRPPRRGGAAARRSGTPSSRSTTSASGAAVR